VNSVLYEGLHAPKLGYSPYQKAVELRYNSKDSWAEKVVARLKGWGFNTIGAWSGSETYRQEIAYTHILGIADAAGADWQKGVFPDVFSAEFEKVAEKVAREQCAPRAKDPYLLGYFTDNELKWGPDWRSNKGSLADYWELPSESEGRSKAVAFLRSFYGNDIQRFNSMWGSSHTEWEPVGKTTSLEQLNAEITAEQKKMRHNRLMGAVSPEIIRGYFEKLFPSIEVFNAIEIPVIDKPKGTSYSSLDEFVAQRPLSRLGQELHKLESGFSGVVAKRYFGVAAKAIRQADPNHLILGSRFAMWGTQDVFESIGDSVDIISFNNYSFLPPADRLEQLHRWTGKPLMLTEFSFKAMDSGLPNTKGAGIPVATQQDRADHFDSYVTALFQMPFMVGFHWFRHEDEPAEGRFDGEDCNYGLVDIKDQPWKVLTDRMKQVNPTWERVHQSAPVK